MNRGKWLAIVTGAISILLAVGYLLLVQLLDFRGEMQPAPISQKGATTITLANSLNAHASSAQPRRAARLSHNG
ncbi:MAG: glucose-inhibited division protein A [Spirulinaceae cyanobacterium RM2_2_10]|nr:glucose-inhibited division protein A [Spirulinaceae cyanobacterium SM2_1_0]NJO19927.1 glucose-inhibited division protein A [Spirulinaceae cyanobacterium RM2_2_10]